VWRFQTKIGVALFFDERRSIVQVKPSSHAHEGDPRANTEEEGRCTGGKWGIVMLDGSSSPVFVVEPSSGSYLAPHKRPLVNGVVYLARSHTVSDYVDVLEASRKLGGEIGVGGQSEGQGDGVGGDLHT